VEREAGLEHGRSVDFDTFVEYLGWGGKMRRKERNEKDGRTRHM